MKESLDFKFRRMRWGPDTARFQLGKSFGAAILHVFFECGEYFIKIFFHEVTLYVRAVAKVSSSDMPMRAHCKCSVPILNSWI